ncbi:MAG: helix-turn-helix domain-containing protein [Nitrososphaeria archaeon]
MKLICPNCEKKQEVEPYLYKTTIKVKGEPIDVELNLYRCLECGEPINDPSKPQDELDLAYRIYRQRHNLLQPEDIIALRKAHGLSQQDLSNLTGISVSTINRYENGCLISVEDNQVLSNLL